MNILLISPMVPSFSGIGSQQRGAFLARALGELGRVDVLVISATPGLAASEPVSAAWVAWPPFARVLNRYRLNRGLAEKISRTLDLKSYDLICGRYLTPFCMIDLPEGVPTILDLDDHGMSYAFGGGSRRSATAVKAAAKSWIRHQLEGVALRRIGRLHRFWFVTDRDRDRLAHLPGSVLTNIPKRPEASPRLETSGTTILFVGALWYRSNRAGLIRFLDRVWPAILAAVPEARLELVGQVEPRDREDWERRTGVHVLGFVDDLDARYADCAFSVAPIYGGGGSNIKILESLAHGRTCVTTRFVSRRFHPRLTDDHIAAAEDDGEMARLCIDLLKDPERRRRLAEAGNAAVSASFSYDAFRQSVHEQARLAIADALAHEAA